MEMRCREAQEEKVAVSFPQIRKKLILFEDLCNDYTTMLRQTMQEKIPLIREEREINVIRSCVDIMEGIKIVPDENNLEREALAAGLEDVTCFVLTSLESDDPFLDQMMNYLSKDKTKPPPSVTPPTKDQWFFSDQVVTNMRKKASEMISAAKELQGSSRFRFLVAALPKEEFKGATIYQYRDGRLKTEDFSRPAVSDVTAQLDPRDLAWCKAIFYKCTNTFIQEYFF
ncbi:hypothetical protein XENOCAPTIV_018933 [Xenoophorus captivus]|uniref:Uncharacterized protein n=1 Tax=Xenoophorus captivus TaxID=1517983 RepID=A0ABV0RZU2_9TELE